MQQTRLNERYELQDKLGEGGVAVVYRAHDALLDRTVAVKILRDQFTADPTFLDRFRREAQAAARLSHPNIISIYDVGQDDGQYYIVMEYIEGKDLKSLITTNAPLPTGQALAIAEQVCSALEHAHRQGFVHRDIKPQNILISRPGTAAAGPANGGPSQPAQVGLPLVKVADFGLARSLTAMTSSSSGLVLGTVHYMAPEQARGEPATPASDIYSLGIVLYELLTGRLPFESDTPVGLALKHIQEDPAPPSRLNPRVPPTLDTMVLRALAKQPEQRYASVAEMGVAMASYRQFGEQATGHFRPVQAVERSPQAARGQQAVARQQQAPTPASQPAYGRAAVGAPRVATPVPRAAPARRRGFDWLLLILFLITFVAIAGLVPLAYAVRDAVFPPAPTPAPQVQVPNLVGLDQTEAESKLQALGLRLVVEDGRYDDKVPPQQIIAQLTPANTPLAQGHEVAVIVSRGIASVKVPPVVGMQLGEAQAKLSSLGLVLNKREQPSSQQPAGVVLAQEPAAEATVPRGSQVRLTVSVGDRVAVPNLFGRSEEQAQRMIQDAGLATTYANPQAQEDVPPASRWVFGVVGVGGVVSQSPEAGTLVDRGTLVKIAIRKR